MRIDARTPVRARRLLGALGVAWLVTLPAPDLVAQEDRGRASPAAQQGDPQPHKHAWVKRTRKEWVPPEKKVVQVGVDAKGRPIYETQIVKPGYWKTVSYFACGCGATRS